MESPVRAIERHEHAGIPVLRAPQPSGLPFALGLVFRVGRGDETLPLGGISHLVEHLALPAAHAPPVDFNGSVANATTTLWFSGPRDLALQRFHETLARLRERPTASRLDRERGILLTEADSRGSGSYGHALMLRFGATGAGLAGHDEFGLRWVGPDDVVRWADDRFGADAAAVFYTGDRLDALELDLPAGRSTAPPPPEPFDYLSLPSVYPHVQPGVVWATFVLERTCAGTSVVAALERRLRNELRVRAGVTYDATVHREPLTADLTHVFVIADCLPDNADAVRNALLTVLDDLGEQGPTQAELELYAADVERNADDHSVTVAALVWCAEQAVWGKPFESHAQLAAQARAVTPATAASALRAALPSLLLGLPEGATVPAGRFSPYPLESIRRIDGRRFRRAGLPGRRAGSERQLVVGSDGLMLVGERYVRAIPWQECVGVARWSDGSRALWARDGLYVAVDPTIWRSGADIVAAIDEAIDDERAFDYDHAGPGFPNDELTAAAAALADGRPGDAAASARAGVELAPDDPSGWALLGRALLDAGDPDGALEAADRAVTLDPDDPDPHALRAESLSALRRHHAAVVAIRRALELAPAELEQLAHAADVFGRAGFVTESRRAGARAVELYPEAAIAWHAAGVSAQAAGDFEAAETGFVKTVELDGSGSMSRNNLGWLRLSTGRPREALRLFDEALERDPANPHARFNRALALRALGRDDEAHRLWRKEHELVAAETQSRRDPHSLRRRLDALWELGRLDEALAAARTAVETLPDDVAILQRATVVEFEAGETARALEFERRLAELAPDDAAVALVSAWLRAFTGDAAGSRAAASSAEAIAPESVEARLADGFAALVERRGEQAAAAFGSAASQEPYRCCAHAGHGLALAELGDRDGAAASLTVAEVTSMDRCENARRLRERLAVGG